MATLWQNTNDGSWNQAELHDSPALLGETINFVDHNDLRKHGGSVLLFPLEPDSGPTRWLLLAPPDFGVLLNNTPLENGIRVMADRDAIRWPGHPAMYFSTERLARVEPFPGAENVYCPRCKMSISKEDPAVCCPQCGVWHHERADDDKNCWTYAETCSLCDQPTEFDCAEYRWTPESL